MAKQAKVAPVAEVASKFPADVIKAAQDSMAAIKCPASVTLAQWALESGWGQHIIPESNNPFNVKQFGDGPFVEVEAKEFLRGQWVMVQSKFVKYATIGDAFEARGKLLTDPSGPYAHCLPFLYDSIKFAQRIAHIYATDPQYGAKLTDLICEYNLRDYDLKAQ